MVSPVESLPLVPESEPPTLVSAGALVFVCPTVVSLVLVVCAEEVDGPVSASLWLPVPTLALLEVVPRSVVALPLDVRPVSPAPELDAPTVAEGDADDVPEVATPD